MQSIYTIHFIKKFRWMSQRRNAPLVLELLFYIMHKIERTLKNLFSYAIRGFFEQSRSVLVM